MRIVLVVARAENGVIGNEGGMPWSLSSDLKRFRQITVNKPVIMGRKTFESIGKPLFGRDNIIVTRNPKFPAKDYFIAQNLDHALELARECARLRSAEEIMVIGGGEIYKEALPLAHVIELTEVHAKPEGDTFFPEIDESEWQEVSRESHPAGRKDSEDFSFVRLERKA